MISVLGVVVCSLLQSAKQCKQRSLHSFSPTVCCAALSVLIYRLCPAEERAVFAKAVRHLLEIRGSTGSALNFHNFCDKASRAVQVKAELVISVLQCGEHKSQEFRLGQAQLF